MIRYVPTSSEDTCSRLSDALWSLAVPAPLQGSNITQQLFDCVSALNGSCWLKVVTDYEIAIHMEAEIGGIAPILQPWIDKGALPVSTNDSLSDFILTHRGQTVTVWDLFPQYFKDQSKTFEEMIASGLFPALP